MSTVVDVTTADFVVLTALGLEYEAVRRHLRHVVRHLASDGTRYEIGQLPHGAGRVALVLMGEGNLAAAVFAGRAIEHFTPRALILVGVAGGLGDEVALGDVVVATRVYSYHSGREETEEFLPRPKGWPISHRLEQVARQVAHDGSWTGPRVHFKPLVSGEVVLDSRRSPAALLIASHYGDAVAIDMESAGVAEASHRKDFYRTVTIRAISDVADGAKRRADAEGWQHRAAANAAAFAVALAVRMVPSKTDGRSRVVVRTLVAAAVTVVVAGAVLSSVRPSPVLYAVRPLPVSSLDEATSAPVGSPSGWRIVRSGQIVLNNRRAIDLESGATSTFYPAPNSAANGPGVDFGISEEATQLEMTHDRARLVVLVASGPAEPARCTRQQEGWTWFLEGLYSVRQGTEICMRTAEGNIAIITLDRIPDAVSVSMGLHYTVWKTP